MPGRSVRELAGEAFGWLEWRQRTEPDREFPALRDGAPGWVRDLVRAAHGTDPDGTPTFLPDDYRYLWAHEVLSDLAEFDGDPEEYAYEWADAGTDVGYWELLAWLSSHMGRVGYADEGLRLFTGENDGIMAAIEAGQAMERREVFDAVLVTLREREAFLAAEAS